MTGMSAKRYNLSGRGIIKQNAFADLVLFNPKTVKDTATFENPISLADGIEKVFVNGVLAYFNGQVSESRNGVFIYRNKESFN